MGVFGLHTLLLELARDLPAVDLVSLAASAEYAGCGRALELVYDLSAFALRFLESEERALCEQLGLGGEDHSGQLLFNAWGSDAAALASRFRSLVLALREHNIALVFVADASRLVDESQTERRGDVIDARRAERFAKTDATLRAVMLGESASPAHTTRIRSPDDAHRERPRGYMHALVRTALQCGCVCVTPFEEGDVACARVARERNAFAIVSRDSDFACFRGVRYVPYDVLQVRVGDGVAEPRLVASAPCLTAEIVQRALGCRTYDELLAVAALCGNDVTTPVLEAHAVHRTLGLQTNERGQAAPTVVAPLVQRAFDMGGTLSGMLAGLPDAVREACDASCAFYLAPEHQSGLVPLSELRVGDEAESAEVERAFCLASVHVPTQLVELAAGTPLLRRLLLLSAEWRVPQWVLGALVSRTIELQLPFECARDFRRVPHHSAVAMPDGAPLPLPGLSSTAQALAPIYARLLGLLGVPEARLTQYVGQAYVIADLRADLHGTGAAASLAGGSASDGLTPIERVWQLPNGQRANSAVQTLTLPVAQSSQFAWALADELQRRRAFSVVLTLRLVLQTLMSTPGGVTQLLPFEWDALLSAIAVTVAGAAERATHQWLRGATPYYGAAHAHAHAHAHAQHPTNDKLAAAAQHVLLGPCVREAFVRNLFDSAFDLVRSVLALFRVDSPVGRTRVVSDELDVPLPGALFHCFYTTRTSVLDERLADGMLPPDVAAALTAAGVADIAATLRRAVTHSMSWRVVVSPACTPEPEVLQGATLARAWRALHARADPVLAPASATAATPALQMPPGLQASSGSARAPAAALPTPSAAAAQDDDAAAAMTRSMSSLSLREKVRAAAAASNAAGPSGAPSASASASAVAAASSSMEAGEVDEQRGEVTAATAAAKPPPGPTVGIEQLPAFDHRESILRSVRDNRVTFIHGETGCGKSTVVPLFLLDYVLFGDDDDDDADDGASGAPFTLAAKLRDRRIRRDTQSILCTQPRRIAAVSLAKRVASVVGETVGRSIGYRIGQDAVASQDTRLTYCTTGYLLELLCHQQRALERVAYIVVDEAHERSIDSDLLCLVLRIMLDRFPHLRLVVMSATLQISLYHEYFAEVTAELSDPLFIGQKRFPVTEHFLEHWAAALTLPQVAQRKVDELAGMLTVMSTRSRSQGGGMRHDLANVPVPPRYNNVALDLVVDLVVAIARPAQCVLVFLPGISLIERVLHELEKAVCPHARLHLLVLHSSIAGEEQDMAFQPPPPGHCKVILSTNIAESSVTIPDVVNVIDVGLERAPQNAADDDALEYLNVAKLTTCWASKASAAQRAGRAGRVMQGNVYRLVTHSFFKRLPDFGAAEMNRLSLEDIVLTTRLRMEQFGPVTELLDQVLEPPERSRVVRAVHRLAKLSIFKRPVPDSEVTMLGLLAESVPFGVGVSRLLLVALMLECECDVLLVLAALTEQDAFYMPHPAAFKDFNEFADQVHSSFFNRFHFDGQRRNEALQYRALVHAWLQLDPDRRSEWCVRHAVSKPRVRSMVSVATMAARGLEAFLRRLKDQTDAVVRARSRVEQLFNLRHRRWSLADIQRAFCQDEALLHLALAGGLPLAVGGPSKSPSSIGQVGASAVRSVSLVSGRTLGATPGVLKVAVQQALRKADEVDKAEAGKRGAVVVQVKGGTNVADLAVARAADDFALRGLQPIAASLPAGVLVPPPGTVIDVVPGLKLLLQFARVMDEGRLRLSLPNPNAIVGSGLSAAQQALSVQLFTAAPVTWLLLQRFASRAEVRCMPAHGNPTFGMSTCGGQMVFANVLPVVMSEGGLLTCHMLVLPYVLVPWAVLLFGVHRDVQVYTTPGMLDGASISVGGVPLMLSSGARVSPHTLGLVNRVRQAVSAAAASSTGPYELVVPEVLELLDEVLGSGGAGGSAVDARCAWQPLRMQRGAAAGGGEGSDGTDDGSLDDDDDDDDEDDDEFGGSEELEEDEFADDGSFVPASLLAQWEFANQVVPPLRSSHGLLPVAPAVLEAQAAAAADSKSEAQPQQRQDRQQQQQQQQQQAARVIARRPAAPASSAVSAVVRPSIAEQAVPQPPLQGEAQLMKQLPRAPAAKLQSQQQPVSVGGQAGKQQGVRVMKRDGAAPTGPDSAAAASSAMPADSAADDVEAAPLWEESRPDQHPVAVCASGDQLLVCVRTQKRSSHARAEAFLHEGRDVEPCPAAAELLALCRLPSSHMPSNAHVVRALRTCMPAELRAVLLGTVPELSSVDVDMSSVELERGVPGVRLAYLHQAVTVTLEMEHEPLSQQVGLYYFTRMVLHLAKPTLSVERFLDGFARLRPAELLAHVLRMRWESQLLETISGQHRAALDQQPAAQMDVSDDALLVSDARVPFALSVVPGSAVLACMDTAARCDGVVRASQDLFGNEAAASPVEQQQFTAVRDALRSWLAVDRVMFVRLIEHMPHALLSALLQHKDVGAVLAKVTGVSVTPLGTVAWADGESAAGFSLALPARVAGAASLELEVFVPADANLTDVGHADAAVLACVLAFVVANAGRAPGTGTAGPALTWREMETRLAAALVVVRPSAAVAAGSAVVAAARPAAGDGALVDAPSSKAATKAAQKAERKLLAEERKAEKKTAAREARAAAKRDAGAQSAQGTAASAAEGTSAAPGATASAASASGAVAASGSADRASAATEVADADAAVRQRVFLELVTGGAIAVAVSASNVLLVMTSQEATSRDAAERAVRSLFKAVPLPENVRKLLERLQARTLSQWMALDDRATVNVLNGMDLSDAALLVHRHVPGVQEKHVRFKSGATSNDLVVSFPGVKLQVVVQKSERVVARGPLMHAVLMCAALLAGKAITVDDVVASERRAGASGSVAVVDGEVRVGTSLAQKTKAKHKQLQEQKLAEQRASAADAATSGAALPAEGKSKSKARDAGAAASSVSSAAAGAPASPSASVVLAGGVAVGGTRAAKLRDVLSSKRKQRQLHAWSAEQFVSECGVPVAAAAVAAAFLPVATLSGRGATDSPTAQSTMVSTFARDVYVAVCADERHCRFATFVSLLHRVLGQPLPCVGGVFPGSPLDECVLAPVDAALRGVPDAVCASTSPVHVWSVEATRAAERGPWVVPRAFVDALATLPPADALARVVHAVFGARASLLVPPVQSDAVVDGVADVAHVAAVDLSGFGLGALRVVWVGARVSAALAVALFGVADALGAQPTWERLVACV